MKANCHRTLQEGEFMLIIFNPTAGERRRRRLDRALDTLRALAIRHEVVETVRAGHAAELARNATMRGVAIVVAAGGDGTIAEVAGALAGADSLLGVLPLGTANVLACELGIPLDPKWAAEVLARRRPVMLHPGQARFADGSERLFVQMMGAGLDAAIVANLPLGLKRRLGRMAYVLQTARELPRYGYPPIRAVLDGDEESVASVVVSKGHYYGGRFLLAPGAQPGEPGFHVALLREGGPFPALMAGAALPLGLFPRLPGVELRRVQSVQLLGPAVRVQADGDPAGLLPVTIMDAPRALRVLA